ncbi:motility-associated protein, partial [Vibrio parahaemolyticus]
MAIAGIVMVIFCVLGGYIIFGGKIGIIIEAMPKELMIIGGSAAGAFMIG